MVWCKLSYVWVANTADTCSSTCQDKYMVADNAQTCWQLPHAPMLTTHTHPISFILPSELGLINQQIKSQLSGSIWFNFSVSLITNIQWNLSNSNDCGTDQNVRIRKAIKLEKFTIRFTIRDRKNNRIDRNLKKRIFYCEKVLLGSSRKQRF